MRRPLALSLAALAIVMLASSPGRAQILGDPVPPEYDSQLTVLGGVKWERVTLNHLDVRIVALIFGGTVLPTEADLLGFGTGFFGQFPGLLNSSSESYGAYGGDAARPSGLAQTLESGNLTASPFGINSGGYGAFGRGSGGSLPGRASLAPNLGIRLIADPSTNSLLVDP